MKRILLLGDQATGKTTFLNIFLKRPINVNQKPTQGISAAARTFEFYDIGSFMNIQIWDTSGSQYARDMAEDFYQKCKLFIIMVDRSNPQTMNNFSYWIKNIRKFNCQHISNIVVLANKTSNRTFFDQKSFMSEFQTLISSIKLIRLKFYDVNLFEEKQTLQDKLIKPLLRQYCEDQLITEPKIIKEKGRNTDQLNCTNQCIIM